ncbi:MAG: riboflavin biosynthesis protein RibF [Coriobacteriia bacterium]
MTRVVTFERGIEPLGTAVAAIGVFDGVHLGHQALVRDAIEYARDLDVRSVVITFDRDPDRVVQPDSAAPQLLELVDKLAFLGDIGPDVVLVVPFDAAVAAMPSPAFIDDVVRAACVPIFMVVGHDFRFGRNAEGDVATLTTLGADRGFSVAPHDLVAAGGAPVTSTRIRRLVAAGDVTGAAALLGRPHRVRGRAVIGRGEGAAIGVPTANVRPHNYAAVPLHGVYAARATVLGHSYAAGVSVGVPPTFPHAADAVEVHLLDFGGEDLHGQEIAVDFVGRIRDQERFESTAGLAEAIAADLQVVRAVLG